MDKKIERLYISDYTLEWHGIFNATPTDIRELASAIRSCKEKINELVDEVNDLKGRLMNSAEDKDT